MKTCIEKNSLALNKDLMIFIFRNGPSRPNGYGRDSLRFLLFKLLLFSSENTGASQTKPWRRLAPPSRHIPNRQS